MRKFFTLILLCAICFTASAQNFGAGNLVVYRVGDGSAALGSAATAVFLDEYTSGGAFVRTLALPTAPAGGNRIMTASGTATSEGLLTRSTDKQYLIATAYDAAVATASITSSASTTINRIVGRIAYNSTIDATTALTDFSTGSNPRCAVSTNGTDIWVCGGAGGPRYTTVGATTSTQVSTTLTNLRHLNIYSGQLYTTTSSGTSIRLGTIGTGLPTTAGQTITNLPGLPTSTGSPYGYFFADLSVGVPGDDVLYLADDAGGITKYSLVSGTWTSNGTVTGGVRGLTAIVSGSTVTLYATSAATSANTIVTISDASGYNAAFSGSTTVLATAATNTVFRGIALAPELSSAASLIATPGSFSNINTSVGTASSSQSFSLSGTNLTGAPGNVTATASAGLEVSLNNSTFSSSVNIPYSSATLAATTVYVRIAASAPQGAIAGTVTNSGGSANAVVNVTGSVVRNYYNDNLGGALNNVNSWGINPDGTGAHPANFTTAYQVFYVYQGGTIDADWTISGTGSKIVVGDGIGSPFLDIPTTAKIINSSANPIDLNKYAYLQIQNNSLPFIGTIADSSAVYFVQSGTTAADTIRIPALSYYDLYLGNGLKYLSSGTTTIRGDITIDGAKMNGWYRSAFSTLAIQHGISFVNGAVIDNDNSVSTNLADTARFTLSFEGSGAQYIFSDASLDLRLFRLQRVANPTSISTINIQSGTNITVYLGNSSGGGLTLNENGANTTQFNMDVTSGLIFIKGGFVSGTGKINPNYGNIVIQKSTGNGNAGTMYFITNAEAQNFTVNFDPAFTRDSIIIGSDLNISAGVSTGLNLAKGKLVTSGTTRVWLKDNGSLIGGSATAYVDGRLKRTAASGSLFFPLGKAGKYAPVLVENIPAINSFNIQYFSYGAANYLVDPATSGTYPGYTVSRNEFWSFVEFPLTTVDLTFNWNDANSMVTSLPDTRLARFDNTDWNDAGTPTTSGTTTAGSIKVTGFTFGIGKHDFTLADTRSGAALPIRLHSITGKAINNGSQINWVASCTELGSYFVLQRSTDSRSFTDIVTISTNGICTQAPFGYFDANAKTGRNYYRLKLVSPGNFVEYSNIVLVNFKLNELISIMQNPVKDKLTVNLSALDANGSLRVIDMNGRLMNVQSFRSSDYTVEINTSHLKAGTYTLQVLTNNEVFSKKFVKTGN